jgi:hypothetical protein
MLLMLLMLLLTYAAGDANDAYHTTTAPIPVGLLLGWVYQLQLYYCLLYEIKRNPHAPERPIW